VGIKETFLLYEFLTLENLVGLVRERLSWMDEGFKVWFEGRIDIWLSNGPQMKIMSPVCNEEWTTYVGVVRKSDIHEIELVTRMIDRNDVGDESSRLLMLLEVIDERCCAYGTIARISG
jgi:hypothetical protein